MLRTAFDHFGHPLLNFSSMPASLTLILVLQQWATSLRYYVGFSALLVFFDCHNSASRYCHLSWSSFCQALAVIWHACLWVEGAQWPSYSWLVSALLVYEIWKVSLHHCFHCSTQLCLTFYSCFWLSDLQCSVQWIRLQIHYLFSSFSRRSLPSPSEHPPHFHW